MKKLVLAGAAGLALAPAQPATAADIPVPAYQPPPKRTLPPLPEPAVAAPTAPATTAKPADAAAAKPAPKFTQQQIASRLRDLKRLYGAGYLTDEFYLEKVAECQVSQ